MYVPGQIGTGGRSIVSWSWVEATKVIHTGKAMMSSPTITDEVAEEGHEGAVLDHQ